MRQPMLLDLSILQNVLKITQQVLELLTPQFYRNKHIGILFMF